MSLARSPTVLALLCLALPCAASAAAEPDCALALVFATTVVDNAKVASESRNRTDAAQYAGNARIYAINAGEQAKACGCPEALPFLAEAALQSARSNTAWDVTAVQQYGMDIRKNGEAAIAELRRCAERKK